MNSIRRPSLPNRHAVGALWLVALLLLGGTHLPGPATAAGPGALAGSGSVVDALPLLLQYTLSADLGRDDPAYHLALGPGGTCYAANPRLGVSATLTSAGLHLRAGPETWSLILRGWGRGAGQQPLPANSRAQTEANRFDVTWGPLHAWYVNGPLGLQQGWTVDEPPPGKEGVLTLHLAQAGTLRGHLDMDDRGFALLDPQGADRLRYGGLLAHDATGRALPARLATDGTQVRIEVDDAGARYPVTIDPWVQAAQLTVPGSANEDQAGWSVAMSADGTTIAVGAPRTVDGFCERGVVYVYQSPVFAWSWVDGPSAKLTVEGDPGHRFGTDLALSADGTTLVVGAPGIPVGMGEIYVYSIGSQWGGMPAPTATLSASDPGGNLGQSVAISSDGSIVIAGAPYQDVGGIERGAVYVYERPAGGWVDVTETARLTASDGADIDHLGWSVAVSDYGDTVVAGAHNAWNPDTGTITGAAYVFERLGSGWANKMESTRLNPSTGNDLDAFGQAVALSSDGSTVLVGAPGFAPGGAGFIYVRPGTLWYGTSAMNETAQLNADGDVFELGASVALNGDGATAVLGAPVVYLPGFEGPVGLVYIWLRPDGGWSQPPVTPNVYRLGASDSVSYNELGTAVAVSGDGGLVVAGAPRSDARTLDGGAAYVYERPTGGWEDAAETARLIHGTDGDHLGWSVAVSADGATVVVGAPYHGAGGFERGAAFVYARPTSGWVDATPAARLTASDGGDRDHLGWSVAVSADGMTVLAGAPDRDVGGEDQGAVYLYERVGETWANATEVARLTTAIVENHDWLGWSVAASGDGSTVAAGAPGRNVAHVYARPESGWADATQMATLFASDVGGYLGRSVAVTVDGELVVAGAPQDWPSSGEAGAVYLFYKPGPDWADTAEWARLTASDGVACAALGTSVAVSADGAAIIAGAPYQPGSGVERGIAYVYERPVGGWTNGVETARLTASDGVDHDRLGSSVGLSGDGMTAVAGAPWHGVDPIGATGTAYAYTRPAGGWADATETAQLTSDDNGGLLGWSVAASEFGDSLVAGAPTHDSSGVLRGAAYLFDPPPTAVTLAGFWIEARDDVLLARWETAAEVDLLGFHLYRSDTGAPGSFVQLNEGLIPGQASGSPDGASYEWLDAGAEVGQTYYYLLEDVDVHGQATRHGPVSATLQPTTLVRIYLPLVQR